MLGDKASGIRGSEWVQLPPGEELCRLPHSAIAHSSVPRLCPPPGQHRPYSPYLLPVPTELAKLSDAPRPHLPSLWLWLPSWRGETNEKTTWAMHY